MIESFAETNQHVSVIMERMNCTLHLDESLLPAVLPDWRFFKFRLQPLFPKRGIQLSKSVKL